MKNAVLFCLILIGLNPIKADLLTPANEKACTVYFEDGSTKNGTVSLPMKADNKYLTLNIDGKKEKIDLESIKKVSVEVVSGGKIEYHNVPVYNTTGKRILDKKRLMLQSVKGKVNLYIGTFDWSAMVNSGNGFQSMTLNGVSYYCMREGEPAATLIHEDFGQANPNSDFKLFGGRYFADRPDIAEKIKKKEYKYSDLMAVVLEYNK